MVFHDGFRSVVLDLFDYVMDCGIGLMMQLMLRMLVVSLDASWSARVWFCVSPCTVPHRSRIDALRCVAH